MNKKLLYGIIIAITIIIFTIIWKNLQKDEINGGVEEQNKINQNTEQATPVDTAASIRNDVNNIQVDSGIDADLKAIDTEIRTL